MLVDESMLRELRELGDETDSDLVEQLLKVFLHEAPVRIGRIQRATALNDSFETRESAHHLKGMCRQLGLVRMAAVCQLLEDGGTDHLVPNLEQAFRETREFLESRYSLTGM
jgi:HPt (histidine-containing phosphotransfer) domain-containing protein